MLTPTTHILSYLGLRPTGDLGPLTAYTSKRGKHVWFLKAPPTCPPTVWQTRQRNKFRLAARAWRALSDAERNEWHRAETRGKLNITAYNLYVYWTLTRDDRAICTIARQTDTNLIP